jgi:hypothetical protein
LARHAGTQLACEAASAARARHFLRATLREWGWSDDETPVLLVSEVVTTDNGIRPASRRGYAPWSGSGRSRDLVEHLAASWGVDVVEGGGKVVWFEVLRVGDERDCSAHS